MCKMAKYQRKINRHEENGLFVPILLSLPKYSQEWMVIALPFSIFFIIIAISFTAVTKIAFHFIAQLLISISMFLMILVI